MTSRDRSRRRSSPRARAAGTRLSADTRARLIEHRARAAGRPPGSTPTRSSPAASSEMSSATRLTPRDLVDDPARDALEQVVGEARPVGGHRVVGGDRADHDRVGVGAPVALDADRADDGQHAEATATARGRGRRRGPPPGGSRRRRGGSRAARALTSPPTIRIARPGPGNGWRQTIRSGRPSSAATARTSSLNSIRSGSTRSKLEVLGQAADVVVGLDRRRAGASPPDSITSE